MRPSKLEQDDILQRLSQLNAASKQTWEIVDGKLTSTIRFPDFIGAFSFMTAVAIVAQRMDHHPDWFNAYNKVVIQLITHDVGSITDLDFKLAHEIEKIQQRFVNVS